MVLKHIFQSKSDNINKMQKTRQNNENRVFLKASIVLALVVIAAFSPIVFLDQTYYRNTPISPELLGHEN